MTAEIKCAKCETPMEEGFILDQSALQKRQSVWVEDDGTETSFWDSGVKTFGKNVYKTKTFRCPKCSYLEFYTTEKIYI